MNPLLPKLKEAIIAAVPEIRQYENRCMSCGYGFEYCRCTPKKNEWYRDRDISLADVLLVIDDNSFAIEAKTGQFGELSHEGLRVKGYPVWNLHKPLDGQSDEFLAFLAEILV